jgi:hypothetical protein
MDRFDDLGVVDALQGDGRDAEVAVPELALNGDQRDTFAGPRPRGAWRSWWGAKRRRTPALAAARRSSARAPLVAHPVLSKEAPARRWLANAEADHGGAILRRRAVAHQFGAGAAAAKGVDACGSRRGRGSPAGQGRCSGGWRRTRPQTELAESEERDPPTGPARHRLWAHGTPARQRRRQSVHGGLEPVWVVAPAVLHLPPRDCGSLVDVVRLAVQCSRVSRLDERRSYARNRPVFSRRDPRSSAA